MAMLNLMAVLLQSVTCENTRRRQFERLHRIIFHQRDPLTTINLSSTPALSTKTRNLHSGIGIPGRHLPPPKAFGVNPHPTQDQTQGNDVAHHWLNLGFRSPSSFGSVYRLAQSFLPFALLQRLTCRYISAV